MTTSTAFVSRRKTVLAAACFALAGCGGEEQEVKALKRQVQDRYGSKNFAEGYTAAVKGLELSRKVNGDKHADTLYFAQAVSEMAYGKRDLTNTAKALKTELALRSAAGQKEDRLQSRRTLLIKLAEESGDKTTAAEQSVIIARAIKMGTGKDPQPTYKPEESPYPPALIKDRVEGDVELGYSLDANGTPVGVRVIRATPPNVFDAAAIEHFKTWRFTPFIENDKPVSSIGHKYTLGFRMPR